MRKQAVAFGLAGALVLSALPAPVHAQIIPAGQGLVNGVATDAANKVMQVTMQLRDAAGNLVSAVGTNASGAFTIAANPGNYTLVMVNSAGQIIGSSASITVVAGATVTVNVTASALAVAAGGAAAGAGAAAGGGAAAGAGAAAATGASLGSVVVATGAAIVTTAIVQVATDASPSR